MIKKNYISLFHYLYTHLYLTKLLEVACFTVVMDTDIVTRSSCKA
jgi:hypothetical protein